MNTQHLKYIIEVERTGSITQAAENLYIGQPSLSKAVKELEETMGIVIFRRTSKGVVPTERGSEFLRYARQVMAQIEKMEAMSRPEEPNQQKISVSLFRSDYIAAAAVDFVSELNAKKGMDLELWEADSVEIIERVDQRLASLGVIRYNLRDEGYFADYLASHDLRRESVWEFEAMVTFSRKHPLADKTPLKAEMLFPYPEIVMGSNAIPYLSSRDERRPDERMDKRIAVHDRALRRELLACVSGAYAWGAPLAEEMLNEHGLVQRRCPLENRFFRDDVIYAAGHEFTAAEKWFINKLYEHRNKMVFQKVWDI